MAVVITRHQFKIMEVKCPKICSQKSEGDPECWGNFKYKSKGRKTMFRLKGRWEESFLFILFPTKPFNK